MKRRLRSPSPSMVIALIALFVALGGTGYAALKVSGRNVVDSSLTGRDIKDDSVTGRDVKDIGSPDVADRSLTAKDFKPGELPSGQKGEQGPGGPPGATGAPGPTGPAGPTVGAAGGDYLDPLPDPTVVLEQAPIKMPTAGKIYVQASVSSAHGSCTFTGVTGMAGGNCTMTVGIYVDGQPVPKSAQAFGNSSASSAPSYTTNIQTSDRDWSLFGVSGNVAAGDHVIQLSAKITAQGNANSTGAVGPNGPNAQAIVGGIALGG